MLTGPPDSIPPDLKWKKWGTPSFWSSAIHRSHINVNMQIGYQSNPFSIWSQHFSFGWFDIRLMKTVGFPPTCRERQFRFSHFFFTLMWSVYACAEISRRHGRSNSQRGWRSDKISWGPHYIRALTRMCFKKKILHLMILIGSKVCRLIFGGRQLPGWSDGAVA